MKLKDGKTEMILNQIQRKMKQFPSYPALIFQDKTYTYCQLEDITNRLAAFLVKKGIGKGNIVSILIPRCEYIVIAALGVLKSGAAYQPLDFDYPYKRLSYMIRDAQSSLIIVAKEMEKKLTEIPIEKLYMEDIDFLPKEEYFLPKMNSNDLFVLLYTSGSTGVPKGCMLTHGNLSSFCKWYLAYYKADETCHMAEYASFVFDVSMMELFMPLAAGAAVYIVPEEIRTNLQELNSYFEKNHITHTSMTTQIGRQFVESIENHSLRHLTVAGEALAPIMPPSNYQLYNGYGPTEGTILLTIQKVNAYDEKRVPIGKPLDEVELYVLDQQNRKVSVGQVGELCAAGPHITKGYLHQQEQTDQVYKVNPFSCKKGYERIYYTGDMVRYRSDGLLEYLGRKDRQVKIRGFRIELLEVEAALRAYSAIFDTVVIAKEISGEKVLIAYYIANRELTKKELTEFMEKTKPKYMIPFYFIRLKKIPLNINGKVDNTKLPLPTFEKRKLSYEQTITETEKKIEQIYKKLLFVTNISRTDDFFLLGGHSLMAAKLLLYIEQEFSCRLSMKQILEHSVLKDLAAYIDKNRSISCLQKYPEFVLLPKQEYYKSSNAQERIYTAQMICKKEDNTYHLPVVLHIFGTINLKKVKQTMEILLSHYEILRTSFFMIHGEIMQKIEPAQTEWIQNAVKNAFIMIDDLEEKEKQKKKFMQPFSLEKAPLFHWSFVQKADEALIFFDFHHIISDGSSIAFFCREFIECYQGKDLKPQTFQYKEFASWDRNRQWDERKKEWLLHMPKEISPFPLLIDKTINTVKNHKGAVISKILEETLTKQISLFCREQGITESMLLLSVFFLLLYKYNRKKDMMIGTVMEGRNRFELKKMQGMFANTIPIFGHIEPENTFLELVTQIRDRISFAYDHQDCPLEELSQAFDTKKTPLGNLLFDILFVMQNFEKTLPKLGDFCTELEFLDIDTAMYPITLEAQFLKEQYCLKFEYDTELFHTESIVWLANHYKNLLKDCLQNPLYIVEELSMIDTIEQKKLLLEFQGEKKFVPEKTVWDTFIYQAKKSPDKTAIIFGKQKVSYQQLKEESQYLSKELSQFLDRDCFGVILAERGLEMIFAIFGILGAGGAYVPISPEYPEDRISFILTDCSPKVMISCKAEFSVKQLAWAKENKIPVISIHWTEEEKLLYRISYNGKEKKKVSKFSIDKEQLAYMIYTSGTTGQPKGVMIEHRQLSNLLSVYTDIYGLNDSDCVLQFANFVFDQSVWDIFHILMLGGTLCLIPKEIVKDPERLEEYCNKKGVTVASLTPGFLQLLHPDHMPKLRLLDIGGEAPYTELFTKWSKNRIVFNTYGPTETTVNAASFVFDGKKRNLIPIGKAIANTQIYIMQKDKLCGIGVAGELCIAGAGVARGYLNQEKLNQKCFVKNPFGTGKMYRSKDLARYLPDGNLEFLGRMDNQVKIHGYRIELEEIEAQLLALQEIKQAVVLVKTIAGKKTLCGYYTKQEDISIKEVRKWLLEKLPYYMIPAVFMPLKEMPFTINGKLDKHALPLPEISYNKEYIKPENKVQKEIAAIWEEILQINPIGIMEDFFELGGDSIKAILIVSKLRDQGYQVEVSELMEGKTIQYLADHLIKKQSSYEYREYNKVLPTPIISQYKKANFVCPWHYNQSVLLEFKNTANIAALEQAIKALISYHGMLRCIEDKEALYIRPMEEIKEIALPIYKIKSEKERLLLCNKLQKKLRPRDGIIMQLCLFTGYLGDQLLIILHHLVIDEVSWNILIMDLCKLYQRAKKKEKDLLLGLPKKTISYGEWSVLLKEYKKSTAFEQESIYWKRKKEEIQNVVNENQQKFFSFFARKEVSKHGFVSSSIELSKEVLNSLLILAEKKYHTRLDTVLLAGLMQAVYILIRSEKFCFELESHGRGRIHKKVRTDRTIGWFTAVYPLVVNYIASIEEQIAEVKEALFSVPNYGMAYGLLKEDNDKFCGGIIFNYLGKSQNFDYGELIWSEDSTGQEISSENGEKDTISFNIRTKSSGLEIEYSYDIVFKEEKVMLLVEEFKKNLIKFAKMQKDISVTITPSDKSVSYSISFEDWNLLKKQIHAEEMEKICPLTPLQQGMFYHWIADPKKTSYLLQDEIILTSPWNPIYMQKSMELLVKKYEVCRAAFYYKGLKQPYQIILYKRVLKLEIAEYENWQYYLESERKRGFDLTNDPLIRILAFPISENKTKLLITQHHIIMDGWSFSILLSDLERYYYLLCKGETVSNLMKKVEIEKKNSGSFSAYLYWRKMQPTQDGMKYWKEYLKGYKEIARIQKLHPIEKQSDKRTKTVMPLKLQLSEELSKRLRAFTKEYHITMSLLFETSWGLLLQWENNISDVVFYKTVSGREAQFAGIESIVGLLINTIPVRIKTEDNITIQELLYRQQTLAVQGMKFEHIALSQILDIASLKDAFIQTLFVYENYYRVEQKESIFKVETIYEETNYPLTFFVEEGTCIEMNILYDKNCFCSEQIERMLKRMEFLLWQLITQPKKKLKELERIPISEKNLILGNFSGRVMEFPKKTVLTLLKEFAIKQPEKTAVIIKEQTISYAQLYAASLILAEKIGIGGERFIAIIAKRSLEMIIGIFAVLFSGAAYVPIDPFYPLERIRYLLDDCKPVAIMTAVDLEMSWLIEEYHVPIYSLDIEKLLVASAPLWKNLETKKERFIIWEKTDTELWDKAAYMIYTSGTTGRPKGVIIEHKSLSNMVYANASFYGFCESDIVLQMANYVFDQSVWDIFGTLGTGGTLCLIPKEVMKSAEEIENYAKEHNITVLMTTTILLEALHEERIGKLRLVDGGGDIARHEVFQKWSNADKIVNSYGPTEITVNATAYCYQKEKKGKIPIGHALPNKKIYILQKEKLCGIGMTGEICIAGKGLARSYLHQEELTKKKFVCNPFGEGKLYRTGDLGRYLSNGMIEYQGRIDNQVKIRGFRIELSEIEQCLKEHPQILSAAVVDFQDKSGNSYLSAYFIGKKILDKKEVQIFLRKKLPDYMLPAFWHQVDFLPLNESGKLDVSKLKQKEVTPTLQSDYEEPNDYFEKLLAELFKEILELPYVGRNDSFFELGGNSIALMKLLSRLTKYHLNAATIFEYSTPKTLGAYLLKHWTRINTEKNSFLLLKDGDKEKPSFLCVPPSGGMTICYMELFQIFHNTGRIYGMTDSKYQRFAKMSIEQLWEQEALKEDTWEETLKSYEKELQKVWKEGDIFIGYSQGGMIAHWLTKRLEQKGHKVGAVVMLEAVPNIGEYSEKITKKEKLQILFQIFSGNDILKLPKEELISIKKVLLDLVSKQVTLSEEKQKEFLHLLLETYLVIDRNVTNPLKIEGRLHCPIYTILLEKKDMQKEREISILQNNPWKDFTTKQCKGYKIAADPKEHLFFLSKYKEEIAECMKRLELCLKAIDKKDIDI